MEPSIVVASTCSALIPTDRIIKEILGTNESDDLPEPLNIIDGIRFYPWYIQTKYYNADVQICAMDEKTIGNQAFAESVNAVIICFDSSSNSGLEVVEQWLTFTKEFDPDISILICERCLDSPKSDGVQKLDAQKWCVEHNFELVELNPVEDELDDEDDFPESLGMKRVIQALQAHIWPNLKLKDIPGRSRPNPGFQSALSGLISCSDMDGNSNACGETTSSCLNGVDAAKIAKVKPVVRNSISEFIEPQPNQRGSADSLPPIDSAAEAPSTSSLASDVSSEAERNRRRSEKIDAMLEAMDALPEENFEQLFQNLSEMKSKAENLSPSQRRAYAEKMTLAFWRSIGGNESEIEGLSSDEE